MDTAPKLFVEAPRGHGKSNILSEAMPIYELGRDPNLRIKLISQSDDKAKDHIFAIRQHFANNPLLKLAFPDMKLDPDAEESKKKLTVLRPARSKDPSIEAAGVLSSATGGRADLLIFDDIVDMRNSILQPQLKEMVKQKVLAEWMPTLAANGRVWVVNTPWTTSDICAYLKQAPGFQLVSTPVGTPDDPFEPIWPEKWPREKLMDFHQTYGPVDYDRAYRCIALSADVVPIQPAWIRYYDAEMLGDPWQHVCLQSYDLAISLSKHADYFAGVTLLYDETRNLIFVVDAWQDRLTLADQARRLMEEAEIWQPSRVVFEKVGYQGAFGQYLAQHAKVPLPVWPFQPRGNKGRRLVEVTPLFQDARVFFHPNLNPQWNPSVNLRGDVVGQLLSFPVGAHDDLVDALVQGIIALREAYPSGQREDRVGFEDGAGISTRITLI